VHTCGPFDSLPSAKPIHKRKISPLPSRSAQQHTPSFAGIRLLQKQFMRELIKLLPSVFCEQLLRQRVPCCGPAPATPQTLVGGKNPPSPPLPTRPLSRQENPPQPDHKPTLRSPLLRDPRKVDPGARDGAHHPRPSSTCSAARCSGTKPPWHSKLHVLLGPSQIAESQGLKRLCFSIPLPWKIRAQSSTLTGSHRMATQGLRIAKRTRKQKQDCMHS